MRAKIDEKLAELETIHKISNEPVFDFFCTFLLISDPNTHVESETGGTELAFPESDAEVGGGLIVYADGAEFCFQETPVGGAMFLEEAEPGNNFLFS